VTAGDFLTYTIVVTNNGPNSTLVTFVEDELPPSVFISVSTTQGTCGHEEGFVSCDLGDLLEGSSATITIVVRTFLPVGSTGETITNTVSVFAPPPDPNPTNDTASAQTTVLPP
jgi:uncharacterized repeat protein (TIGR01451 family)